MFKMEGFFIVILIWGCDVFFIYILLMFGIKIVFGFIVEGFS